MYYIDSRDLLLTTESFLFLFSFWCFDIFVDLERKEESECKIDDLDHAEDREASEKSHRSTDEAELSFKAYLHILFDLVISGRVEVYLHYFHWSVLNR